MKFESVKSNLSKKGFSLIELLVVISIISLLSSIVLVSVNSAREKAKIAVAKSDLRQLQIAMQMFLSDKEKLPPEGGNDGICSSCNGVNPCFSDWTLVVSALVTGGYLSARIDRDPWGGYYCYDDNYRVLAGTPQECIRNSPLWSMGPDMDKDTSWNQINTTFLDDDIGIIIEPPQC